jgi:hypothetical protein
LLGEVRDALVFCRKPALSFYRVFQQYRHIPVIEPAKEVAGSRHAWRLKFGRIDQWEGAILGVSAEISQITDAPRLDCAVNLFLFLVE